MNAKFLLLAGILFVAGFTLGNLTATSSNTTSASVALENDRTDLEQKLADANTTIVALKKTIASIKPKHLAGDLRADHQLDEHEQTDDAGESGGVSGHDTVQQKVRSAYSALEEGNFDAAMKQFNALLANAVGDEERSQIIDGLIAVREAQYDAIMQDGNYIHGAMWQLFEIHKLRPDDYVVVRAKQLSQDVLMRSEEFLNANDLLNAADYLNALVHTSNMMRYEVEGVDRNDLVAQVKEIEANPEYQADLYLRASNRLLNGSEFEQSLVFWDYAKLAEIDSDARSNDPSFNSQFADAAFIHLTHLKEMNQTGEINSRLNYIRYAFPSLMDDDRISQFH